MSGMSGDTESSCDIPWAVIAFPLLGESGAPLSSQTEDGYRVSQNIRPRALKAYKTLSKLALGVQVG